MVDNEKIGALIKATRIKKDMSQVELAKKLGVSREAVSKWENGHHLPDISILDQLAEALDLTRDELLDGEYADSGITEKPESSGCPKKHFLKKALILIAAAAVVIAALTVLFRDHYCLFDDGKMTIYREHTYYLDSDAVNGTVYMFQCDKSVKWNRIRTGSVTVEDGTRKANVLLFSVCSNLFEQLTGNCTHEDVSMLASVSWSEYASIYNYIVYYPGDISILSECKTLESIINIVDDTPGTKMFPRNIQYGLED